MTVAIIDCGGANLRSVQRAVELRSMKTIITNNKDVVSNASFVILPGVGSASSVMNSLKSNSLIPTIKNLTQPVLGICIGMHVLFDYSEEDDTQCLGIINGEIKKFISTDLSIPQMGWNYTEGLDDYKHLSNYYYFANSFYSDNTSRAVGYSNYINKFTSVVKQDNYIGCQFHPEKSSLAGEAFLKYFINQI